MRFTNTLGLPAPVVRAAEADTHHTGEAWLSVTDLLKPPQVRYLEEQYADRLSEDVKDLANQFIGNGLHEYLEKYVEQDEIAEQTFYMMVGDRMISGTPDFFLPKLGHIFDWKTPKTYEWYHPRGERAEQLNIYAELLRANGYNVNRATIVFAFKDWSPEQHSYKKDYPPGSMSPLEIDLWPREVTQAFIRERVALHEAYQDHQCNDEDRWIEVKYAAIKPGASRATKLFDTEEEALAFAGDTHDVETRIGEPTRCKWWCSVAQWCPTWQGEQ